MSDLRSQLREYGNQLDAGAQPLRRLVPDTAHPAQPLPAHPNRRGWVVAAVSAFLVLMLIGGAVWMLRASGSSGPPAEEPAPTTLQPSRESPPSSLPEPGTPPYSLVRDPTYLGVKFFDESVLPYNAYPELEGWVSVGPNPVGNEHGSMQVYRRGSASGREDLLVLYTGPDHVGVDGLRLTGDTSNAHLILECSSSAALLMPGSIRGVGDLDKALRAWRPGPDGTLEEFDPATGTAHGAC